MAILGVGQVHYPLVYLQPSLGVTPMVEDDICLLLSYHRSKSSKTASCSSAKRLIHFVQVALTMLCRMRICQLIEGKSREA